MAQQADETGETKGSVSHLFGVWEYQDEHREPLSADERATVLARVVERAATSHGITLEITGE